LDIVLCRSMILYCSRLRLKSGSPPPFSYHLPDRFLVRSYDCMPELLNQTELARQHGSDRCYCCQILNPRRQLCECQHRIPPHIQLLIGPGVEIKSFMTTCVAVLRYWEPEWDMPPLDPNCFGARFCREYSKVPEHLKIGVAQPIVGWSICEHGRPRAQCEECRECDRAWGRAWVVRRKWVRLVRGQLPIVPAMPIYVVDLYDVVYSTSGGQ